MEVKPYEKNAKKHPDKQLKQIAKSIKEFGWQQPIVVDKDGVIIVGHGRWFAYEKFGKEMNLPEPEIKIADLSKEKAKAYRLADNKLNESEWDMGLAIEELKGLSDEMFDLTGFDKDLLIDTNEDNFDAQAEYDKITQPVSKQGDLWALGEHRLLCGDSTKRGDVEKVMGGGLAKLVFTSPPYNMGAGMYENYEDNLKSEEYINFNLSVIENCKKYLRGFLFWNISYNKNSRSEFIEIIYKIVKETGLKFLELIVWDKGHALPITSKEGLTRQYEDILLVGDEKNIASDLELYFLGRNDKRAYFNKKTQRGISNYWRIGTNKIQLENHLACYPVALPIKGIELMTERGDIILDPFCGSGTTIIASEKSGRKCYGIELDEKYCDVIIKRYEDYTGNKGIKIG